ncbi:MAG: glycoside hydrolase family 27 protein, partial [Fimbriimonadaceae bacterium]|nr:glycoside hydrolase family 27 protein [Fimbriimonadaceae bacterium]
PDGLAVDAESGQITGSCATAGTYALRLHAANRQGAAEAELRLVVGDAIALTPPLGCNTWGGWGPLVSEAHVRAAAAALHASGLAQHGFQYVNIDDGWQGQRGGPLQAIQPNQKFGDPAALCADLHALGLKVGTYSTPWVTSYAGFIGGYADDASGAWEHPQPVSRGWRHGRHSFAAADVAQLAAWGFDYLKYDWGIDSVERATEISALLRACGRDVVLELSNSAPLAEAGEYTGLAQMCRTAGDLVDVWDKAQLDPAKQRWALGIRDLWLAHRAWREHNRPGHWNMPCPLRVGLLGGWDEKPLAPTRLTVAEQYSHLSLWCLWSAPLIIGCPPERLDEFTLGLLTNDEVLAVDQDLLGQQAHELVVGGGEALVKELADGQVAVGLFNVADQPGRVAASLAGLGLRHGWEARDLWRRQDLGPVNGDLVADLPAHGCQLLRLAPR